MKKATNIFLVGPMGAGKTTIGRQLAKAFDYEFIDSDHEIEERTGATIPWIFDIEGEAGFRKRETAALADLTERHHIVLATGGGAVIAEENRDYLKNRGFVVYLFAALDDLLERTARDRGRPLLQTDNPRQRLADLVAQRDGYYREVADLIVDTGAQSFRQTVTLIIGEIDRLRGEIGPG